MASITQNKRIALFSLWSFNQTEAGKRKKRSRNICLMEKNILYDNQSMIKFTNIS